MALSEDINNKVPEDVKDMYSEVLYEMYKPSIEYGRQIMICKELILSLRSDRHDSYGDAEHAQITTGSFYETHFMKSDFESDIDVMLYKKSHIAKTIEKLTENHADYGEEIKPEDIFVMDSTGCFPGYVNVYQKCSSSLNGDSCSNDGPELEIYEGTAAVESFFSCLSNSSFYEQSTTPEIHGPAVSATHVFPTGGKRENDLVYCIPCPNWPPSAQEWLTRDRPHNNPTRDIVTTIVKMGCHIVPTNHPLSQSNGVSWRLSFSVCEKTLIRTWTTKQMLVFHLIKYLLKNYKKKHSLPTEATKVLGSYHIKTALFWAYEQLSPETWKTSSVVNILLLVVDMLRKWVKTGHFPQYWVRECNLMDFVTDTAYCLKLLEAMKDTPRILRKLFNTPFMRRITQPKKLYFDLENAKFLHKNLMDRLPLQFTHLKSEAQSQFIDHILNFWPSVLHQASIETTSNVITLLEKIHSELQRNNIDVDEHLWPIIEGRFYFVKYRISEEEECHKEMLEKAIACFEKASACECDAKDIVKTLSSMFLANANFMIGNFEKADVLCDEIIANDKDKGFNCTSMGYINLPEPKLVYYEDPFCELNPGDNFQLQPHVFAIALKMKCLERLHLCISCMDPEYVEEVLENVFPPPMSAEEKLLESISRKIKKKEEKKKLFGCYIC